MRIARCLIIALAIASLVAEDSVAAAARIVGGIESGRASAAGSIKQLAGLGDDAYVASLPALLAVLETRAADAIAADSLLSTLARVDVEIPALLLARVKAWAGSASDGQFLALLEAHQREFTDLRAEADRTANTQDQAAQPPSDGAAQPPTQAPDVAP